MKPLYLDSSDQVFVEYQTSLVSSEHHVKCMGELVQIHGMLCIQAIHDAYCRLQVDDKDEHWHFVRAYPPNLLVMACFNENIVHLRERHAKSLPFEGSIPSNKFDKLTESLKSI